MKKFFVSIAIFAVMFLTVSCGGDSSSSGGNGGNNSNDNNGGSEGEGGESETPADVSECSANGSFPCKDSANGLVWSAVSKNDMNWNKAVSYCEKLTEGGLNSWRLPTISELRTILQNCDGTVAGGVCAVNDPDHLSLVNDDSSDCRCEYKGEDTDYSRLGDGDIWLWSSSVSSDDGNDRWCAVFGEGGLAPIGKDNVNFVRCVKNAE